MRKVLRVRLPLLVLTVLCGAAVSAPQALAASAVGGGGSRSLATITGSVRDNKGKPLVGAVVSLLKEGAGQLVKQVRSGADGGFTARIAPGLYQLRATADGFGEVLFSSVQVRRSEELIYRFNLEPVGSGRTAPERRRDRNDPKWRILGTRSSRSIFQVDEAETPPQVAQANDEENAGTADEKLDVVAGFAPGEGKSSARIKGVVETYFASSADSFAPGMMGVNFAFARPASNRLDFVVAGQTGVGATAPQRLEATARMRLNHLHRVSLSVGAMAWSSSSVSTTRVLSAQVMRAQSAHASACSLTPTRGRASMRPTRRAARR